MNQGRLYMGKQETARVNADILGIRQLTKNKLFWDNYTSTYKRMKLNP